MTSIPQTWHGSSPIRLRPLIIILIMHAMFFFALSRSNAPKTEKGMSGNALTFLTPVTTPTDPLIQKVDHEKAVHQQSAPAAKKEPLQPSRTSAYPASAEKSPAPLIPAKSFADISAGVEADAPAKATIDLGQLRSQATLLARESAQRDASESGNTVIFGDYYGSYNGADTGTFYIHVDRIGNIFGSADSGTAHSSFTITGKVSTDGVVQMTGKGLAGSANFDGKINLKTGAVAGHWNLTGFGRGQFAGQRAKALGGGGN